MSPYDEGFVLGEIREVGLGASVPDHLDTQLRQPKGTCEQRPDDEQHPADPS